MFEVAIELEDAADEALFLTRSSIIDSFFKDVWIILLIPTCWSEIYNAPNFKAKYV